MKDHHSIAIQKLKVFNAELSAIEEEQNMLCRKNPTLNGPLIKGKSRTINHGFTKEEIDILERITDGYYALDLDWNITYWNKEAEAMLGKSREEVLNRSIWQCFPDGKNLNFYDQFHLAIREQKIVYFEGYYPPRNIWAEMSIYPSRQGLSVFFKNITGRKQAEAEMSKLSLVAMRTTNAVMFTDANQKITWVNNAFSTLTGYSIQEAVGKQPNKLLQGPLTDQKTARHMRNQLKKKEGFKAEVISYKKNRETFWTDVTCQPILDENGNIQQFFSIESDITERKRAEQELSNLSLIVREAPDPIFLLDLEKKITWVNEAFIQFTGFTMKEVAGKRPGQVMRGSETDLGVVTTLQDSWEKKDVFHGELVIYNKHRERFIVDISSQPLLSNDGSIHQFFVIMNDLTEKKRLQEQLTKEKEERQRQITKAAIKAQEEERSEVGKELHDNVNQVLTTVKLYAELCRDGIGNTQDLLNKSIGLLNDSINEIRGLSNRLSAPSLGNIRLKDSIKDLVETILTTNRVQITLDAFNIEKFDPGQELHLSIYRILQEHLTNILKHSEATAVNIRIQKTSKHLNLKVEDDGKGFDVNTKRKGIGITNMTSRAESLNGKLNIMSSPGQGCILVVKLPLQ